MMTVKLGFYMRFITFSALMACFNFLGPAVDKLTYQSSGQQYEHKSSKGQKKTLTQLNEFFLLLVRLCLGLFEQDLAHQFGISQSSVSRILMTWINFVYLQLKQISLWAPKGLVLANVPKVFKVRYPTTRVIVDATEILLNNQPYLNSSN